MSWTGFCLGLNFVSDYIPQLYFVCNHLICVEIDGKRLRPGICDFEVNVEGRFLRPA